MEHSQPQGTTIAGIAKGLRRVLRFGVRPARLRDCEDLIALRCVHGRVKGSAERDVLAFGLEAVLVEALAALGDGPYGRAARLLFGVELESKGRLLKDRRRLAAQELDVLPSTFRQNYEDELLLDLAAEVYRIEL